MNQPYNIMIGTPAYAGMVHVSYVSTLLEFTQARIRFSLSAIGNESLITRGRNTIAAGFLEHPEFTHLLFLDGDVSLSAEGALRMLAHGKDVIGAPVALKGRNADGSRTFNVGRMLGEEGTLLIAEHVGTAVLLLSRRAVEALAADAKDQGHVYERGSSVPEHIESSVLHDIFRVGVQDGHYLSEDYWICRSLRRLGFKVYVDPTVVTAHVGTVFV